MKAVIKNIDLMVATRRGLLTIDTSDLTVEEGYKVFRTLKELRKAAETFEEARKEIVRLKVSDEEQEKANAYDAAKDKSAAGLISAEERVAINGKREEAEKALQPLLDDFSEVEARPVSFETWYKLKAKNGAVLRSDMDMMFEGVLWKDDGEEKPAEPEPAEGAESKPKRR